MEIPENIEKQLVRIGLTKNEARIYYIMLKLGQSLAGRISKASQINRTTTYDILKKLLDRGLIAYVVKSNRKWFEVVNPDRFMETLKEREEEFSGLLPTLKNLYGAPKEKHDVTLYYGTEGMKSIYMDIVREGQDLYIMDSDGEFTERMPYLAPKIAKLLAEKGIKVKQMVGKSMNYDAFKNMELRTINKKSDSEAVINIYGNRVAVLLWKDPPEGILIKSSRVASVFKEYFEILWKIAAKLEK
jgi:HTH-type transcriptional regulator, sugar sensing transcriptional regulator